MATEFCQRCKQSHPGSMCDYDDKGECAQTIEADDPENTKESLTRGRMEQTRESGKMTGNEASNPEEAESGRRRG